MLKNTRILIKFAVKSRFYGSLTANLQFPSLTQFPAMKTDKLLIYSLLLSSLPLFGACVAENASTDRAEAAELPRVEILPQEGKQDTKTVHFSNLDHVRIDSLTPSQEKEYQGFRVSFNKDNHTPNWVAWELLGTETDGPAQRINKFRTDWEVEGCPSTADYKHSGYDRGHLCPAADQKWSVEAMEDCFYLTNIAPQDHSLNSGAWNTLEGKERTWARRDSAIVIVAGPIYESHDTQRIGDMGVRVPGAFFKAIAAPYANPPRGIAFVYPNMSSPGNMENYVMSISDLEQITGYDFFYALPDEIERQVESTTSFREWNRRK